MRAKTRVSQAPVGSSAFPMEVEEENSPFDQETLPRLTKDSTSSLPTPTAQTSAQAPGGITSAGSTGEDVANFALKNGVWQPDSSQHMSGRQMKDGCPDTPTV